MNAEKHVACGDSFILPDTAAHPPTAVNESPAQTDHYRQGHLYGLCFYPAGMQTEAIRTVFILLMSTKN